MAPEFHPTQSRFSYIGTFYPPGYHFQGFLLARVYTFTFLSLKQGRHHKSSLFLPLQPHDFVCLCWNVWKRKLMYLLYCFEDGNALSSLEQGKRLHHFLLDGVAKFTKFLLSTPPPPQALNSSTDDGDRSTPRHPWTGNQWRAARNVLTKGGGGGVGGGKAANELANDPWGQRSRPSEHVGNKQALQAYWAPHEVDHWPAGLEVNFA